jgi:exonuclease VII large subunit
MQRGYAIARSPDGGPVIRDADVLQSGDDMEVYLHKGMARVTVDRTGPGLESQWEIENKGSDEQREGNE